MNFAPVFLIKISTFVPCSEEKIPNQFLHRSLLRCIFLLRCSLRTFTITARFQLLKARSLLFYIKIIRKFRLIRRTVFPVIFCTRETLLFRRNFLLSFLILKLMMRSLAFSDNLSLKYRLVQYFFAVRP